MQKVAGECGYICCVAPDPMVEDCSNLPQEESSS